MGVLTNLVFVIIWCQAEGPRVKEIEVSFPEMVSPNILYVIKYRWPDPGGILVSEERRCRLWFFYEGDLLVYQGLSL